jgi:amino acid transporter
MLFYFALLLSFLYFKIARVYKKEEKPNISMLIQNVIVLAAVIALFAYGFMQETWYVVVIVAFLFFILSSLMVSAVQLGIFIDGKPFIKLSHLYKSLAFIGMFISFTDLYLWGI